MRTAVFFLILLSFFYSCESKHEALIREINELIENEQYQIASNRLRTILESQRASDELLSSNKPKNERILVMSNDRNRVLWLEASDFEDNCAGDPWEDPRESVRSPRRFR